MTLDDLLSKLIGDNVSDIHFKANQPPMIRINGLLSRQTNFPVLKPEDTKKIAYAIMKGKQSEEFEKGIAIDTSYQLEDKVRFRVNVYRQRKTVSVAMRLIPMRIPGFEELRLPPVMKKIALEPRGLILLTGVTGSGKSTTLACIMNYLNSFREGHILTIEDPIEFLFKDNKCSITQVEIGYDSPSFEEAITASIRQDPDVLLVGEMRDLETVKTALKAAEMGYLVFSTLHTTDCSKTINRILDIFPGYQQMQVRHQLSANLKAVVSQRLLPLKDGSGRIVACEIMRTTRTIQVCIEEPDKTDTIKDSIEAGRSQYEMQSFDQHLTELYQGDMITLETAVEASSSPADFQRALTFR